VSWADTIPTERPVYLLANEFLDALPIRQYVRRSGAWFERTVGLQGDRLTFGLSPFPAPFGEAAPEGAVREIRPAADAMARHIAGHIAALGAGAALFVDYGYDTPGHGDTLQAVRAHTPVDVLDRPGETDLSAHVDFAALAAAAREAGAVVHGPVGQGAFLLALGLIERAGQIGADADEQTRRTIEAAVARLAGDGAGEMGALFKAVALTARAEPVPGFQVVADAAG
jgi:SAM-dependent MidA family methyltransferase